MAETSLQPLTEFALELARTSRAMLAEARGGRGDAEFKPDRSFVTSTDAAIEARLREMIAARFPAHGIIGEEAPPLAPEAEHVWVLDPIDGTAAFIAGIPVYSTLIALCRDGRPVIGVMDFPAIGQQWLGVRGSATTLNGQEIRTRPCAALDEAILSTSNPDLYPDQDLFALDLLRKPTAWTIYGTAALAYGRLAEGRTDLAVDSGLKIWDIAPFVPVIEGAGGVITDWRGAPIALGSGPRVLAAGDPALHRQALGLIDSGKLTQTG